MNRIGLRWLVVVVGCVMMVILMSGLWLPQFEMETTKVATSSTSTMGTFGFMMIQMLPQDVAFTVFVPWEMAVERDLRLNHSGLTLNDDAYAIVSRVVGFSAIPRALRSGHVAVGQEVCYESICGYALCISKDAAGMLVVNNRVRSRTVDLLHANQVVVHIMDGVIMDSEFEESVRPDEDEDD